MSTVSCAEPTSEHIKPNVPSEINTINKYLILLLADDVITDFILRPGYIFHICYICPPCVCKIQISDFKR